MIKGSIPATLNPKPFTLLLTKLYILFLFKLSKIVD